MADSDDADFAILPQVSAMPGGVGVRPGDRSTIYLTLAVR